MGPFAICRGLGGLPVLNVRPSGPCVIYSGADEAPPERNLLLPISVVASVFAEATWHGSATFPATQLNRHRASRSVSPVSGSFRTEFGEAAQRSIFPSAAGPFIWGDADDRPSFEDFMHLSLAVREP
jgi:hypothetical protein